MLSERKARPVRLKEVARYLGISISTVSAALENRAVYQRIDA